MTQTTEEKTQFEEFSGIGCESIKDVEIPSASAAYFAPVEGDNLIRFLQGPKLYYISQQWEDGKPVGDKKIYKHDDLRVKKDPDARLIMAYLIYSYDLKAVKIWEISQPTIQKYIKKVNNIQANISKFDVQVSKTKRQGTTYSDFAIVQGEASPFKVQAAIDEVMEKPLHVRLDELQKNKDDEQFGTDEQVAMEAQIEAAHAAAVVAKPAAKAAAPKAAPAVAEETPEEDAAPAFKPATAADGVEAFQ